MSIKERWKYTQPLRLGTQEILEMVLPVLRDDQRIRIVYLFGSRIRSEYDKTSDVDIGFYSDGEFSWDDYYRLYGNVTKKLRTNRVDLLWLNKADCIITFQVIKNGQVVYYSDAETLNSFELRSKRLFYDYGHYLQKRRHGL